jgi:hypothetical protein
VLFFLQDDRLSLHSNVLSFSDSNYTLAFVPCMTTGGWRKTKNNEEGGKRNRRLTRLLSIRRGRRKGSKTSEDGLISTGLCRFPSLQSFQSGFKTPQKSTPVKNISKKQEKWGLPRDMSTRGMLSKRDTDNCENKREEG